MKMLVKTYDAYDLKRDFEGYNRDYFSMTACEVLIDLFNEFEEPQEVDVIGICCDFNEEYWEDIKNSYSNYEDIESAKNIDELIDTLNNYTIAYETEEGQILYQVW